MLKCGNQGVETEVQKPKYGSGKKSPLPVPSALLTYVWLCLVDKGWLSQSDVRHKYWHIGFQRALTQWFSMTQWVYSCRSLIPRLQWPFVSVSGVVLLLVNWSHWRRTMTILASASLSRLSRSIEPSWLALDGDKARLAHSSFVLVWVWLQHAIATLTAVL